PHSSHRRREGGVVVRTAVRAPQASLRALLTQRSLAGKAPPNVRRHQPRHRRRQAGSTRPCGPMVRVRRSRDEPGGSPRTLGMLTRGGQSGAAEGEETKRRGGYRGAPATGGALATSARTGGT